MKNNKKNKKEKKEKFEYPCILEVSKESNFATDNPHLPPTRPQVCIGKLDGRYMCIYLDRDLCVRERLEYELNFVKHAIKSGSFRPGIIQFWDFARKINL